MSQQAAAEGAADRAVWRGRVEIRESTRLHGEHHRLVLEAPQIAGAAEPGQFLHLWVHDPVEIDRPPCAAILRRPYSIARLLPPDGIEILLRVRGTGGRLLAAKRPGEYLDVIGPLGHGFRLPEGLRVALVVAGGAGLAPTPFLLERLAKRGVRTILLAGATDDQKVPFRVQRPRAGRATVPELAALAGEVTFVSEQVEGLLITEVAEIRLGDLPSVGAEIFAIGPRAMLKRLAEVTGVHFPLQVSLEERMACGVGACRSCVVPVRSDGVLSYRTVCRDGPVFYASTAHSPPGECALEVAWDHLDP